MLNVIYLVREGLPDFPVLFLSSHILRTKGDYYRLLQAVRDADAWDKWVLRILEVLELTAARSIAMIHGITTALFYYKHGIRDEFKFYSQDLINQLFMHSTPRSSSFGTISRCRVLRLPSTAMPW